MKEIYKVQTPKRIVFGDPLYFEEFSGARLEQLVVDVQPPEAFGARVVLREFSAAEAPDTLIRTMEVYLAPEEDMDIFVPVSPSGTGNTFNSSTRFFWFAIW